MSNSNQYFSPAFDDMPKGDDISQDEPTPMDVWPTFDTPRAYGGSSVESFMERMQRLEELRILGDWVNGTRSKPQFTPVFRQRPPATEEQAQQNTYGLPTLEDVLARARAAGEHVDDIREVTTARSTFKDSAKITEGGDRPVHETSQPESKSSTTRAPLEEAATNSTHNRFSQRLRNPKFKKFGASILVVAAAGTVVYNKGFDSIPVIGTMFSQDQESAAISPEQLPIIAEKLANETVLEKPINNTPIPISQIEPPSTLPEIYSTVNYTATSAEGAQLTLAEGVRLAMSNVHLQLNYQYKPEVLEQGLAYDADSATFTVDPKAIKITSLLLGNSTEETSTEVPDTDPAFDWAIATVAGKNQAIKDEIITQNPNFSDDDINLLLNALSQNQVALSQKMVRQTLTAILGDPVFAAALSESLYNDVSADLNKISSGAKLAPFVLDEEFLTSLVADATAAYPDSPLVGGLSTNGQLVGLKIPSILGNN